MLLFRELQHKLSGEFIRSILKEYIELNWNLGCPHPQVANKKLGSGLLQYPDIVNSILDNVISKIDISFSIKCRLGHFSVNELAKLVPVFNSFPISEITIHARIGKQLYSGQPDMETFSHIVPQLYSPSVYNGDIVNIKDYTKFKKSKSFDAYEDSVKRIFE